MLGRIEEAMTDFEVKGVKWTAKTLTSQGPSSQEKPYGADFIGVLDIALDDYSVKKGFLAQSKRVEPGGYFPKGEFERLRKQCEDMLRISSDSFVFLYSVSGVVVVPAVAIVGSAPCNPHSLYARSVSRFFEEHFECFIGDRRLHTPSIDSLMRLKDEVNARSLLYLLAINLYREYLEDRGIAPMAQHNNSFNPTRDSIPLKIPPRGED
jgi:hypothetical protein